AEDRHAVVVVVRRVAPAFLIPYDVEDFRGWRHEGGKHHPGDEAGATALVVGPGPEGLSQPGFGGWAGPLEHGDDNGADDVERGGQGVAPEGVRTVAHRCAVVELEVIEGPDGLHHRGHPVQPDAPAVDPSGAAQPGVA